jgi:hypothetical protein
VLVGILLTICPDVVIVELLFSAHKCLCGRGNDSSITADRAYIVTYMTVMIFFLQSIISVKSLV